MINKINIFDGKWSQVWNILTTKGEGWTCSSRAFNYKQPAGIFTLNIIKEFIITIFIT
jgi:hypothetical protein